MHAHQSCMHMHTRHACTHVLTYTCMHKDTSTFAITLVDSMPGVLKFHSLSNTTLKLWGSTEASCVSVFTCIQPSWISCWIICSSVSCRCNSNSSLMVNLVYGNMRSKINNQHLTWSQANPQWQAEERLTSFCFRWQVLGMPPPSLDRHGRVQLPWKARPTSPDSETRPAKCDVRVYNSIYTMAKIISCT